MTHEDRADGARAEASARLEPRRPDQVEAGLAELRSVLAEDGKSIVQEADRRDPEDDTPLGWLGGLGGVSHLPS